MATPRCKAPSNILARHCKTAQLALRPRLYQLTLPAAMLVDRLPPCTHAHGRWIGHLVVMPLYGRLG
jgi:hypothetical protein